MRRSVLRLCLLLALVVPVRHASAQAPVHRYARDRHGAEPELPDANALLAHVRAQMPRERVALNGRLLSKQKTGHMDLRLNVEVVLEWGLSEPRARYTIRNSAGGKIQELALRVGADGKPVCALESAGKQASRALHALDQTIQGTDMTWLDLSLAFLWASEAKTEGVDSVKGRPCFVLALPYPPWLPDGETPRAGHDGSGGILDTRGTLRLWVDRKLLMLLRAEEYDPDGTLLRRLSVKSVRKFGETWAVKDLEVKSYPSRHRTLLRVDHVYVVGTQPAGAP